MLSCSYVCTQSRAEFRTISYISGLSKKKNLLASFLIGCLKVALQKSSVAKPSRRKMVGVSVIIFWYLSLQSWTGVQWEGASRLGDHFTFQFWISGLHEGFFALHGNKILLLWLPGHNVPSGAAQASRASEQLQQWRPDMR